MSAPDEFHITVKVDDNPDGRTWMWRVVRELQPAMPLREQHQLYVNGELIGAVGPSSGVDDGKFTRSGERTSLVVVGRGAKLED